MADKTKIEWTDATVNFWWGCTKVGPGCDSCYAEAWDNRLGGNHWGKGAARRWIKSSTALIRKLDRQHDAFFAEHSRHRRVFIQSMSDLFDNEVDTEWRWNACAEIYDAVDLDIQIVTKRVSNVERMVPASWRNGHWPRHVGLIITVCTQAEAERDIPRLIDLKRRLGIPWVGLSMEPLLEHVALRREWLEALDWIIVGGESGRNARPMHPDWARPLRDQCAAAGVPFLFKQWGEWAPVTIDEDEDGDLPAAYPMAGCADASAHQDEQECRFWQGDELVHWPLIEMTPAIGARRVGKKAAGRMLDGVIHDAWPEAG